jgi:hypothetical protein
MVNSNDERTNFKPTFSLPQIRNRSRTDRCASSGVIVRQPRLYPFAFII